MQVYPIWTSEETANTLEDEAFSAFLSRRSALDNGLGINDIPAKARRFMTNGWMGSKMREGALDLLNGRGILCMVGRFEYTDVGGNQRRHSDYCAWIKSDGVVVICHKHNEEP